MSRYTLVVRSAYGSPDEMGSEEDRALLGTYESELDDTDLSAGDATEAVLQAFHDTFGIENVEDLLIHVFNENNVEVCQEEDSQVPDETASDPDWISDSTEFPVPMVPTKAPKIKP